ncbi:hypothetical protein N9089_04210, partial [Crocinitomicaceae bacterium]|nr:hypothetical protein [Crocinitomicaceae bacterium]
GTSQGDFTENVSRAQLGAALPGTRYLVLIVDPDNSIDESSESNNAQAIPLTDIVVNDVTTTDFRSFNISYEINDGDAPAFIFRAYLSSDDVLDPAIDGGTDTRIPGQHGISNSSDRSVGVHSTTFTLPSRATINEVHRFVLIVADPDDGIQESNEGNNVAFAIPLLPSGWKISKSGDMGNPLGYRESSPQASGPLQGVIPLSVAEQLLTVQSSETRLIDVASSGIWSAPGVNLQISGGIRPWTMPSLAAPLQTLVQFLPKYSDVWSNDPIVITSGYRVCSPTTRSMHCEARALDIQVVSNSLQDREVKTRRLAGLAWLAGFDWAQHEFPGQYGNTYPLMHVSKARSFLTTNLQVQIFSPADILVVAPDGKRSGADPRSGKEFDEIPLSFFTGGGTHPETFSMIAPENGAYTVQAIGTDFGEFTISVVMTDLVGEVREFEFVRTTAPGLSTTLQVEYTPEAASDMSVIQVVDIDAKPGSDRNPINLNSKGVIPISIFTTDDFNASWVDVSTVQFAGASPAQFAYEDLDGDGDMDLILHFRLQDTGLLGMYEDLLREDLEDGTLDDNHKAVDAVLSGVASKDGEEFDFLGTDSIDMFLNGKKLKELLKML